MLEFANNATTLLTTAITASDTSIVVSAGSGALFPAGSEGAIFKITLRHPTTGAKEIVHGTARSSDTIPITRAQEGTTALAFPVNTVVGLRITKETSQAMLLGRRNRLINGKFDYWDDGIVVATPGTGTYVAPQWRVRFIGSQGTQAISRQAVTLGVAGFDVEPKYVIRWDQNVASAAAATLMLLQPIEGVRNFSGKTVTVSFWAKNNSGGQIVNVLCEQEFGTGGSPSAAVQTAATAFTLSSVFKKYQAKFAIASISGKTIGSNNNDSFNVIFKFTDAVTHQNDITLVQCEESPIATPFEFVSLAQTRRDCDRFYWNTFPDGTAPAQNAGVAGAYTYYGLGTAPTAFTIRYRAEMRAAPTLTTYNPSAANANARNTTTATDAAFATPLTDANHISLVHNVAVAGSDVMKLHLAFNARL